MSVAIVIFEGGDAEPLVWWAAQFARARDTDLLVLDVTSRLGETAVRVVEPGEGPLYRALEKTVAAECELRRQAAGHQPAGHQPAGHQPAGHQPAENGAQPAPPAPIEFVVKQVPASGATRLILTEVDADVELLILPRGRDVKSTAEEFSVQRELFRDAPCATMQLIVGGQTDRLSERILVPTRGHRTTSEALHTADSLAAANDGRVTALYVLKDFDQSELSAGQRIIRRLISRHADDVADRISPHAIVNRDVVAGIRAEMEDGYDLVLLGATYHSRVHRMLFSSISERLLGTSASPAMAVIRPAIPLGSRALRRFEHVLGEVIPQLDRTSRVDLVERIDSSSQWNFDFVALICLSTLIATLGLLQNSGAVVIGAMLVAPLMTPLLGSGLSLVQGNDALALASAGTVARGFLLALLIAVLVGLLTVSDAPTDQMTARGSPGLFDLIVAFASGMAAAYASGRPNLLSALPGVAIAAALVPPISTAGVALAHGWWTLAGGALLLFLTNIVSIVLGAACTLWGVGIRGAHSHGMISTWVYGVVLVLLVILVGLGVYETMPPRGVPSALHMAITHRIAQEPATSVDSMRLVRHAGRDQLHLVVEAAEMPDAQLTADLAALVSEQLQLPVEVRLETRLIQIAEHD